MEAWIGLGGDLDMLTRTDNAPVAVGLAGGDHIRRKSIEIHKQIAPHALAALGGAGGVGQVPGNDEHIPCGKRHRAILKGDGAAVRMAEADLQTVVEVQPGGGLIGDTPLLAREREYGQIHRKIINSIFNNIPFCTGHG